MSFFGFNAEFIPLSQKSPKEKKDKKVLPLSVQPDQVRRNVPRMTQFSSCLREKNAINHGKQEDFRANYPPPIPLLPPRVE